MDAALAFLEAQVPVLLYLLLGAGAAVENLFPPVPADTFVVVGGFLAARGHAHPWGVFFATWSANSAGALLVFAAGRRFGRPFFQTGLGRHLLNPRQLERLGGFYARWGLPAIFFARFVPGLRAMVPVFAGVTRQGWVPVAGPILVASGIWYGGLVWLGAGAGRNLDLLGEWMGSANRVLVALAALAFLVIGWWWWSTRRGEGEDST